ncbi:NAD(P)H-dependent oxidoreductase [Akkermansiaceae bacterium]|nr:NAD(P)H-dependent oxidoreductase [Akkermansiaceae bacterium]MDB4518300.1 NAD(P)H-dependent oxidoreductase [Akkermansiaceae bacterium]
MISPENLLKSLQWRYATKAFDSEQQIPESIWSSLEDSLILTPSSFGLQPWHFFVITNPEIKAELLPHSWNQAQVTECSHFVVLAAQKNVGDVEISQLMDHTSTLRKVETATLDGYRKMMSGFMAQMNPEELLNWAKLQTYIALGQLMTSASVLGVDACPMEGFVSAEYDRILGLEEKGLSASVACALGYRSTADKYAELPKVRYEKSELISRL